MCWTQAGQPQVGLLSFTEPLGPASVITPIRSMDICTAAVKSFSLPLGAFSVPALLRRYLNVYDI